METMEDTNELTELTMDNIENPANTSFGGSSIVGDTEDVRFLINNNVVRFAIMRDKVDALRKDDAYTMKYIQDAIDENKLDKLGIRRGTIVSDLDIQRITNEVVHMQNVDESSTMTSTHSDGIDYYDNYEIWKSKGKPTDKDSQATEYMLRLRLRYQNRFEDERSLKQKLWNDIAAELADSGFNVGEGRAGGLKCRQKFANLSKSYYAFTKQYRLGSGILRRPPEHFKLLHSLLKDKPPATKKNYIASSTDDGLVFLETEALDGGSNVKNEMRDADATMFSTCFMNTDDNAMDRNTDKMYDAEQPVTASEVLQIIERYHENTLQLQREQFQCIQNVMEQQNKLLTEQLDHNKKILEMLSKHLK